MTSRMKAELFACIVTRILPYGNLCGKTLKSIKCAECGSEIEIRREKLIGNYAVDFIERILTKPYRMTRELEKDLTKFILSLPIRIITKPYRIAKEVGEMIKKEQD